MNFEPHQYFIVLSSSMNFNIIIFLFLIYVNYTNGKNVIKLNVTVNNQDSGVFLIM